MAGSSPPTCVRQIQHCDTAGAACLASRLALDPSVIVLILRHLFSPKHSIPYARAISASTRKLLRRDSYKLVPQIPNWGDNSTRGVFAPGRRRRWLLTGLVPALSWFLTAWPGPPRPSLLLTVRRSAHQLTERSPASVVVSSQLQIVAQAVHPHGDVADAGPGVEPGAQGMERAVIRGHRTLGEADSRTEEPAALVEHALFDNLVRAQQQRLRDREAERLRGLEIDD